MNAVDELIHSNDRHSEAMKEVSNTLKTFSDIYQQVHLERNKIEEAKLNFEIAKYKFENKE